MRVAWSMHYMPRMTTGSRVCVALVCCSLLGCGSSEEPARRAPAQLQTCEAPDLPVGDFDVRMRPGPSGTLYVGGEDGSGASLLRRYVRTSEAPACAWQLDQDFGKAGVVEGVRHFDLDAAGRIHAADFGGGTLRIYDSKGQLDSECKDLPGINTLLAVSPDGKTRYLQGLDQHQVVSDSCVVSPWQAPAFVDAYLGVVRVSADEMAFAHQDVAYLTDLDGVTRLEIRSGEMPDPDWICFIEDLEVGASHVEILDGNCSGILRFDRDGKFVQRLDLLPDQMVQPRSFSLTNDGKRYVLMNQSTGLGLFRLD